MADHVRSEPVVDALQMAIWNRRLSPERSIAATTARPTPLDVRTPAARGRSPRLNGIDRGLLRQLRRRELFATLQTELLDRSVWPTREGLGNAVVSFIDGFYNSRRRHFTLGYLSPADYEA